MNAHKMPRTRTLDFDDGMQSVEWAIKEGIIKKKPEEIVFETILEDYSSGDVKSGVLRALTRAGRILDEWFADEQKKEWDKPYPQFWDTLIIDSATALTEIAIDKGLDENQRLKLSKTRELIAPGLSLTPMRTQDWGAGANLFMKLIKWVKSKDKNLVLIAHERVETDDEGAIIAVKPSAIGRLRDDLPKDFDEVWYTIVRGSRNKPKFEFQTAPDPRHKCSSRLGCLDAVEDADFYAIRKKVAEYYGIEPEILWTDKMEGDTSDVTI